jgi:hypothetical protein
MPVFGAHECISGTLRLRAAPNFEHQGIRVELVGELTVLDPAHANNSLVDSRFFHAQTEICGPATIADGLASFPFAFVDGVANISLPSIASPLGVHVCYYVRVHPMHPLIVVVQ